MDTHNAWGDQPGSGITGPLGLFFWGYFLLYGAAVFVAQMWWPLGAAFIARHMTLMLGGMLGAPLLVVLAVLVYRREP